jgi:beta-1,4-mannosyl-glycoprotein beta-1,4-N-acetylglucosaminyltransferase
MVLEQQQEVQEKEFALLCLNMIVKNESHIIKDKLTKLLQKIKFDYWVISDTGSTDETIEIITDFFKEVGIPGELYEDDWVDFSHNRNRALEYAFGKSKYLLVFDADDEICGDFVLPELTRDSYSLQFGSYTRPQIVNNRKRWKYVGVLHEYICSADSRIDDANTEIIKGPYHVVSGRSGNRNLDSDKYLKDAIILENAYNDAVNAKDDIYIRYGFYCANSYYDCGKYESAISWYKKTLENGGWVQEKYVSCLKLYNCYNNLDNKEAGFFYLVKSAEYDRERAECYYELIKYYSGSGLYDVAYGYYGVLCNFYENSYLKDGLNNKLFVDTSISEFHLPYYFIIVCEKMCDYQTGIHMYRIIFTKKCKIFDTWFVSNMLYNLQFFTAHVKEEDKLAFYSLFQEYVDFLVANNYPVFDGKHEFMKTYEKYGIKKREEIECSSSNKILIYTGFMDYLWNDTYVSNNPIGGAEKAVAYLARNLPKEYEIIISGDVADEVVGNVTYVNRFKLQALLDVETFHTIIVSRYVSFFILFPRFNCHQLYLSAHDTGFLNNFNGVPVNSIIEENNKYINGVICLTTWHKLNMIKQYPCLKNKILIINNGILVPQLASSDGVVNANDYELAHNKIKNKIVWTSCSSRGLDVLLKLWDKILEVMPDATLDISSYDAFPNPNRNKDEEIQTIINNYSGSVKHHGKLNTSQLHNLISKAEFWLYTNTFYETSCITALEMLVHEVVCLYYPLAGLVDTIGEYGIQVNPGNEIQSIVNLSEERKAEMRINGKKYAMSCSWENRAKEWAGVLGLNNHKQECKIRDYRREIMNEGQSSSSDLNIYVQDCIDSIGVNNIQSICDVGCGKGLHTSILKSKYPDIKFTGIDWSINTINYLKSKVTSFDEVVHCKSSNLPFDNKQFSLALCMENLEHLYSNESMDAFKEMKRISDYIIITFPRPEHIVCHSWLNKEIVEAEEDSIPLSFEDFIALESCVHKTGYYDESLIHAGFKKANKFHPYNGIYYCKSDELDISKIEYHGINSNDVLSINKFSYNEMYIDLLKKSLNLKFFPKKDKEKKIIDCFIFYNELDMLNYRLNILDKVVDYFVLVESTHTFVGKEKLLFYNENKHFFSKFNHKIIHIIVDDIPHKYPNINIENNDQWNNEKFQRNCISRGIDKLNLSGEDIITITDLDEIPNPTVLAEVKNNKIDVDINTIELDFYYYNLNSKMDHKWHLSKILTFEKYKKLNIDCESIRFYNCPVINNGGWHLSYFGDETFIKNKIENFSHQELNKIEFTDEKRIEERIKNGNDLFDRDCIIENIPVEDNNNLPPDYDIYLKNYYDSNQLLRKDIDAEMKINSNKKERTDVLGLNNDNTMNVGFFVRHFTERGTEVAIYDYAKYNEEILNNKSYIITDLSQKNIGFSSERKSYSKFNSRFPINNLNHNIKYGVVEKIVMSAEMTSIDNKYNMNKINSIKKEWVFFCSTFFEKKMIQQYIDNLNLNNLYPDYYIHLTSDKEAIMKSKPEKVTIVYEVFDSSIFNALPNSNFSFLNTEPLTIPYRLDNVKLTFDLYKKYVDSFNYYDYSESNLRLLNDKCIGVGVDKVYLPYKCSSEELSVLQNLNKNTKKEYDFGILKTSIKEVLPRRKKIVDFLKSYNFSINIIEGWNYNDRDFELAKCKIILNIHGNLNNDVSTIFEHIRCDRLLEAGFNILSEMSYDLSPEFIQKYPNLRLIEYEDFFDIGIMVDCYNNPLMSKEHNKYVLDILNNCYNKIDIPLVHISFIEKLSLEFNPNRMVIYDIGSNVLHWTKYAKVFWKNSTVYLFDAMTEMKLFYDEYNKIKNTTLEYNVGVLCDEDYKRISFYQNDEISGGNSYYKEIGHPDSHNIFTENHIKHKIGMKLETVVKNKKIPLPDLIKIDVQGAELDILKGSMKIINNAKFLIVELQHIEYNKGAPLCNKTRDFLIENGWEVYAEKFSNNGPDADWCFINKNRCIVNPDLKLIE